MLRVRFREEDAAAAADEEVESTTSLDDDPTVEDLTLRRPDDVDDWGGVRERENVFELLPRMTSVILLPRRSLIEARTGEPRPSGLPSMPLISTERSAWSSLVGTVT